MLIPGRTLLLLMGCVATVACTGTIDNRAAADASIASSDADLSDSSTPDPTADAAATQADARPQSDDGIPAGEILFQERFDDADFSARDWYDGPRGNIDSDQHAPGSTSAFECTFDSGTQGCSGGTPSRRKFAPTSRVYLSFYIKHSSNWVGSQRPYHPHLDMQFNQFLIAPYIGDGSPLTQTVWIDDLTVASGRP